jgi:pimeloyl-ACP methyl ester carboxylesterase
MLFVPTKPAPAGGRNIVAIPHGTVGVASRCAPSNLGASFYHYLDALPQLLAAGDAVVAPDFQGLGTAGPHPYLVGGSEADSTLDAVRAARLFAPAHAGTRFAVAGSSQGGQAALFTAQKARAYAPELTLVGVAAAAPATDLVAILRSTSTGTFGRILSAYAADTWSQVYPQLHLSQIVTAPAQPVVKQLARICIVGDGAIAAGVVSTALKITYLHANPWESAPWKGLLEQNSPGGAKIGAPILITQGTDDKLIAPSITAMYVKRLCAGGETVDYRSLPGVGHIGAGPRSSGIVAKWIADRFAGAAAPDTCR